MYARIRLSAITIIVSSILLLAQNGYAFDVYRVDCDAAGDNDGSSWVDAFTTIQAGINAASSGDEVWVAGCTYTVSGTGAEATLKAGVDVYGGFVGTETLLSQRDPVVNVTVLNGNNASYHVVVGASNAILDGFTITGGNGGTTQKGGGLYVDAKTELVVSNCVFEDNYAQYGGAVFIRLEASVEFDNCAFHSNTVSEQGGAIFTHTSTMTVSNCEFDQNTAASHGGAIYNFISSAPIAIIGCIFESNSAYNGAGIYDYDSDAILIDSCVFNENEASNSGGGIYFNDSPSANVVNSLFTGNTAGNWGGGIQDYISYSNVVNCTFTGNSANYAGGFGDYNSLASNVTNSILYGNTATYGPQIYNNAITTTVTYSDVEGGYTGTGNINSNPLFVGSGDYHLTNPDSPCVNAGTSTGAPEDDLDGNDRPFDSVFDMGAYEVVPRVFYVVEENDGDYGRSWTDAFSTVQEGIDAAWEDCEVWVKEGTYTSGSTNPAFSVIEMKEGVDVYGGFAGTETSLSGRGNPSAYPTILDGEDIAYHVVIAASDAILNGFKITGGSADGNSSYQQNGGGLYGEGIADFSVEDCLFYDNYASQSGGAINFSDSQYVSINSSIIDYNSAFYMSGGISMIEATEGSISNSIISRNITNMNWNSAVYNGFSDVDIINCTATNNDQYGYTVYTYNGDTDISNSILWNAGFEINPSNTSVTYSDVKGGYSGNGNIDSDPLFVNDTSAPFDFHIALGSPCVDTGDPGGAPEEDIEGNARPMGLTFDMGAYEYDGFGPVCVVALNCPASAYDVEPFSCEIKYNTRFCTDTLSLGTANTCSGTSVTDNENGTGSYDADAQLEEGQCTAEVQMASDAASDAVIIEIKINHNPYFTSTAPTSVTEGVAFSYEPTYADADLPNADSDDPGYVGCLGITENTCDLWLEFDGCDASGTPTEWTQSTCSYVITISDGWDLTATQEVTLQIVENNQPPSWVWDPIDIWVDVNENYVGFNGKVKDNDYPNSLVTDEGYIECVLDNATTCTGVTVSGEGNGEAYCKIEYDAQSLAANSFCDVTIKGVDGNASETATKEFTIHPYISPGLVLITSPVDGVTLYEDCTSSPEIHVEGRWLNLSDTTGLAIEVNNTVATSNTTTATFEADITLECGSNQSITAELTATRENEIVNFVHEIHVNIMSEIDDVIQLDFGDCTPGENGNDCTASGVVTAEIAAVKSFTTRVQEGRPSIAFTALPPSLPGNNYYNFEFSEATLEACLNSTEEEEPCNAFNFFKNMKDNGIDIAFITIAVPAAGLFNRCPDGTTCSGNQTYCPGPGGIPCPNTPYLATNLLKIGHILNLGIVISPTTLENMGDLEGFIENSNALTSVPGDTHGFSPFVGIYLHDEGCFDKSLIQEYYQKLKSVSRTMAIFAVTNIVDNLKFCADTDFYSPGTGTLDDCLQNVENCPTEDISLIYHYSNFWTADERLLINLDIQSKLHQEIKNSGKSGNFMVLNGTFARWASIYDWGRMPMEGSIETAANMGVVNGGIGDGFWIWGGMYPYPSWVDFFGLYDADMYYRNVVRDQGEAPENIYWDDPSLLSTMMSTYDILTDVKRILVSKTATSEVEIKQNGYLASINSTDEKLLMQASLLDKTDRTFTGVGIFKDRSKVFQANNSQWVYPDLDDPSVDKSCYLGVTANPPSGSPPSTTYGVTFTARYYTALEKNGMQLLDEYQQMTKPIYQYTLNQCYDLNDGSKCRGEYIFQFYLRNYKDLPYMPLVEAGEPEWYNVRPTYTEEEKAILNNPVTGFKAQVKKWILANYPDECVGTSEEEIAVDQNHFKIGSGPYISLILLYSFTDIPNDYLYVINYDVRSTAPGAKVAPFFSYQTCTPSTHANLPYSDPEPEWSSVSGLAYYSTAQGPCAPPPYPWGHQLYFYFPDPLERLNLNDFHMQQWLAIGTNPVTVEMKNLRLWPLDDENEATYSAVEGFLYANYFEPFRNNPGTIPSTVSLDSGNILKYDISTVSTSEFTISGWYIPEISSETTGTFVISQITAEDAEEEITHYLRLQYVNEGTCNPVYYDDQCPVVGELQLVYGTTSSTEEETLTEVPVSFAAGQPVFWAYTIGGTESLFIAGAYGNKIEVEDITMGSVNWDDHFEELFLGTDLTGANAQEGYSSQIRIFPSPLSEDQIINDIYKCGGKYSGCTFQ